MKAVRLMLFTISLATVYGVSRAQGNSLKKVWIKSSIEEFSRTQPEPDTSYVRYVFSNSTVLIGFEPSAHFIQLSYSVKGNTLTMGFDQWTIESLTDSTLTIFLSGFRRMKFVAEDYLRTRDEYLERVGEYKGKPLYKANRIVTPRYKKPNPLVNDISKQDRSDDYNIRKAGTFRMSFIVTEEGKIEDPKILIGVAPGYDKGMIRELLRTSGQWSPATFKGQAIQTLLLFEIKFLDSLDQY
jgi:hypothetical protein